MFLAMCMPAAHPVKLAAMRQHRAQAGCTSQAAYRVTSGFSPHAQGQCLALQQQRQHRAQAGCAPLRIVAAQAATMEAPARTTGKGPSEAAPELGTQKPTVSAMLSPPAL